MASHEEEESLHRHSKCEEIIPGLSNDISVRCLAKLPRRVRAIASCVSRSWKTALHPNAITAEVRTALGISGDNYLFLSFLYRENGKILLQRYLVDLVQMRGRAIQDPLLLPHVTEELSDSARDFVSRGLLADQLDGYGNLILHLEQSSFKNFNYYPPVAAIKGRLFLLLEYAEFAYEVTLMLDYVPDWKNGNDVWSVLPPMNVRKRRCFVCGSLGKYIYVAGGLTNEKLEDAMLGTGKRSAERFDTEKSQWEILPDLNKERVNGIGFVLDGKFYVMGGGKGSRTSGEFYDPDANKWILVPKMWPKPTYLSYFMRDVVVVENRLYAKKLNSEQTFFSLSVWEYNGKRNRWTNLGVVVRHISKLVLCDYRLVCVGDELWIMGMKPDAEPGFNVLACRPSERLEGEEGLKWRHLELGWDKYFVLLLSCFAF
eukprot:Gb_39261 [translate_table: standard]